MSEFLEKLTKQKQLELIKIYESSEREILEQLERAKVKGNSLKYLKAVKKSIEKELNRLRLNIKTYSQLTIPGIYNNAMSSQDKLILKEVEKLPIAAPSYGKIHKEAVQSLADNLYNPIEKASGIIGRNTNNYLKRINYLKNEAVPSALLREAGLEATKGSVVGNKTYQQAQRQLLKDLNSKDVFKIPYYNKQGDVIRFVDAKQYTKMVSRTTTAEAHRQGTQNRIKSYDYDLVKVIGVSQFPTSPCLPYEGHTLSMNGKSDKYESLAIAKQFGLFHPNCIHDLAFSSDNLE